jgi:phosphonoacetate hydrolase
VVLSARDCVLGRRPKYHDLSALDGTLRSHGGRYEEMISMILSQPLNKAYAMKASGDPRNFQIFDFVINGTNQ